MEYNEESEQSKTVIPKSTYKESEVNTLDEYNYLIYNHFVRQVFP